MAVRALRTDAADPGRERHHLGARRGRRVRHQAAALVRPGRRGTGRDPQRPRQPQPTPTRARRPPPPPRPRPPPPRPAPARPPPRPPPPQDTAPRAPPRTPPGGEQLSR